MLTSDIINSLPSDKSLEVTKLKAFVNDKLNIAKMTIFRNDKSRKHFRKRRKCWLPAFSPFSIVFSKAFFFWVVKSRDCVVNS